MLTRSNRLDNASGQPGLRSDSKGSIGRGKALQALEGKKEAQKEGKGIFGVAW